MSQSRFFLKYKADVRLCICAAHVYICHMYMESMLFLLSITKTNDLLLLIIITYILYYLLLLLLIKG